MSACGLRAAPVTTAARIKNNTSARLAFQRDGVAGVSRRAVGTASPAAAVLGRRGEVAVTRTLAVSEPSTANVDAMTREQQQQDRGGFFNDTTAAEEARMLGASGASLVSSSLPEEAGEVEGAASAGAWSANQEAGSAARQQQPPAGLLGGRGGRSALGNGMLALALGVAGFGRLGGGAAMPHSTEAAHAATYSTSTSTSTSTSAYHAKYSSTLLPVLHTSSAGAASERVGSLSNPHFEDIICSRWFVGSINAIG